MDSCQCEQDISCVENHTNLIPKQEGVHNHIWRVSKTLDLNQENCADGDWTDGQNVCQGYSDVDSHSKFFLFLGEDDWHDQQSLQTLQDCDSREKAQVRLASIAHHLLDQTIESTHEEWSKQG